MLKADMTAAAASGSVTEASMAQLFTDLANELTANHTTLSASQFNDLKTIAANLNVGETASGYVSYLVGALVNGNAANADWTGGGKSEVKLGNLGVGATATQINELNGKWFLGTDLPSDVVSMSGTPQFTISYSAVSAPLFSASGPSINDINQGDLGDCYLLAPLAEVAQQDPSAITSMITNNGNGTCGVRFYVNGVAQYVTVNNELPDGGTIFNTANGVNNAADDWAALVEKAYAQLQASGVVTGNTINDGNSFSTTGNGGYPEYALEQITDASTIDDFNANGGSWQLVQYNKELNQTGIVNNLSTASVLTTLANDLAAGDDLVLSSNTNAVDGNGRDTLIADHAMSIYGFDAKTDMLEIRNPWGTFPTGQYWDTTFEVGLGTLLTDGDTITADNGAAAAPAPSPATISSVAAQPSSGDFGTGKTIAISLAMSGAVTVAGGTPTLSLNDGGTASYSASASTGATLVFEYMVAAGQNAAALAVTGLNLNGATIASQNGGGNANLAGAAAAFSGLQIDTAGSFQIADNPLSLNAGTTAAITRSQLIYGDSAGPQLETYTVTSAPQDGMLLLNGSPTSSFTQADINNRLVSYQETVGAATADSFAFIVSDPAGNTTAIQHFQFQITPDAAPPFQITDNPLSLNAGTTAAITRSQLIYGDPCGPQAETYMVTTAPQDGVLLKNGVATSSFTQADINNGLISYQETGGAATADSFAFIVSDPTGNTTATQHFQFQITPDAAPPFQIADNPLSLNAGTTAAITRSQLIYGDPCGPQAETYTVTTAPQDGTLLLNGSPTNSFTQADINNGLVSYQETVGPATADSFAFIVSDPTGNTTAIQNFQFEISPDTAAPFQLVDNPLSLNVGATAAITRSQLIYGDPCGPQSETYTVTAAAQDGTLLKNGSPTGSFTQADINSGLISYRETVGGVASDSFAFTVSDPLGNMTATQHFQINI